MNDIKVFFFNSLTVTTGLIFYSLFVYIVYLIFLKESEKESEQKEINNSEEKEKIDNFDILEDAD